MHRLMFEAYNASHVLVSFNYNFLLLYLALSSCNRLYAGFQGAGLNRGFKAKHG